MRHAFARRIACVALLFAAAACHDVPLGPDLVECHCTCVTRRVNGVGSDGCGGRGCDFTPCPADEVCSASGGCVPMCDPAAPVNTDVMSEDVTLHVCVDATSASNAAQACSNRCDAYASGSIVQCVDAVLNAVGVHEQNGVLPESFTEHVTPSEAQSLSEILTEQCATWALDHVTGTCGVESDAVSGLIDLVLCMVSISDVTLGAPGNAIRMCGTSPFPLSHDYFQVEVTNGCPEFERHTPDGGGGGGGAGAGAGAGSGGGGPGTSMGGEPMPASSMIDGASSYVSVSGADVDPASGHPEGFASTGHIGSVLVLSQLRGTLPDGHMTVQGHDVTLAGGFLELKKPIAAPLTDDPVFVIAPGKMQFIVTGAVNGQVTSIESSNVTAIAGFYDEAAGRFGLAGSLALDGVDATVNVNLVFTFTNRPPQAYAGPDQTVECTLPTREGVVQLDGTTSYDPDPGDRIVSYTWTVGRQFVASGPGATSATAHVGLGKRVASLAAVDTHGSLGRDVALIHVVDTQGPIFDSLTVTPGCLWPPNHDLVLLRLGQEIRAQAHDACDPEAPSVYIKSVTSSQPALGGGSGDTPLDIVNGSAAVCVRAERDGTKNAPRVYYITVAARDTTGNESDRVVMVTVPHDQGGGPGRCADLDPALIVGDGDPRCSADVAAPTQHAGVIQAQAGHGHSGCSLAPGSEPLLGALPLVALALLVARRRRRV